MKRREFIKNLLALPFMPSFKKKNKRQISKKKDCALIPIEYMTDFTGDKVYIDLEGFEGFYCVCEFMNVDDICY